ncbi:MAG: serine/threonine protein kinase [Solirubrobacteraceae bacterium]|nr:serine/threonine protein kinase [Solirubrobacteraceae bacterium]
MSGAPPRLRPGTEVAPGVTVIRSIARSDVLDVYDAWDARRASRVAAKVLRPDRLAHRPSRAGLLREGRLLRALDHPHLVRAYDLVERPDPVLLLETLPGETLARLIDRSAESGRRIDTRSLAVLGLQLCSAIGYLHAEGVIHLDLKPANIIAGEARATVIDLNHAREPGRMKAGTGTWCYAAPEQARGGEVGVAADVWGVAIVLWECATAQLAFGDDDGDEETDTPQLARSVASVGRHRRLPGAFAAAIDGALAPDPAARATLADLARACEDAAGLPARERRLSRTLG